MHATIGQNNAHSGDRTPAVWFESNSSRILICSAINGNKNYCYSQKEGIPMNKYSTVTIQQIQISQFGYLYHYQIFINKVKVLDVHNQKPQEFDYVKYYLSDPWYLGAKANVRGFQVTTFEHKSMRKFTTE